MKPPKKERCSCCGKKVPAPNEIQLDVAKSLRGQFPQVKWFYSISHTGVMLISCAGALGHDLAGQLVKRSGVYRSLCSHQLDQYMSGDQEPLLADREAWYVPFQGDVLREVDVEDGDDA